MKTIETQFTGKLFDIDFTKAHMSSNWDAGHQTYTKDKKPTT